MKKQQKRSKILIILPENHEFGGTPIKFRCYKKNSSHDIDIIYLNENNNLVSRIFCKKYHHIHCVFKRALFFSFFFKVFNLGTKITYHFVNTDKLDLQERILLFVAKLFKYKYICPTYAVANAKKISKFHLIHNGASKKGNNIYQKDPNMLVSVGGLNSYKNHYNLIEAMKFLEPCYNLHIIGDGYLKGKLNDLIIKSNLNKRVFLHGYQSPEKFIQKANLFIHPSTSEGFGISIVEAILSNVNICLSNIPTHKELYGRFKVNFFDPRDPKDIAKKIKKSAKENLDYELLTFSKKNLTVQSFSNKLDNYNNDFFTNNK